VVIRKTAVSLKSKLEKKSHLYQRFKEKVGEHFRLMKFPRDVIEEILEDPVPPPPPLPSSPLPYIALDVRRESGEHLVSDDHLPVYRKFRLSILFSMALFIVCLIINTSVPLDCYINRYTQSCRGKEVFQYTYRLMSPLGYVMAKIPLFERNLTNRIVIYMTCLVSSTGLFVKYYNSRKFPGYNYPGNSSETVAFFFFLLMLKGFFLKLFKVNFSRLVVIRRFPKVLLFEQLVLTIFSLATCVMTVIISNDCDFFLLDIL